MFDQETGHKLKTVAEMIAKAKKVVVFTGAGVSTESGIPDFRSPGGIWTRFDPDDFTIDKFIKSEKTRRKQWDMLLEGGLFKDILPNKAHRAIAQLEKIEKLDCVITQNIDNLHQKAGNDPAKVFELHGSMRWARCLDCGARYSIEEILSKVRDSEDLPVCQRCGGILKPDVIFFGEALPQDTLRQASLHASGCDLMIVVGSSLVVYPAAYMPQYAKQGGARIAIINLSATPLDDMADIVINHQAADTMEGILSEVKKLV
jgi:NAD-dependent deacetylase